MPQVPPWVYTQQIAALASSRSSGVRVGRQERRFDAVRSPVRGWLSRAAVARLLNVDWRETNELLTSAGLETRAHAHETFYRQDQIEALIAERLRGQGPRGRERRWVRSGAKSRRTGYRVVLDRGEIHLAAVRLRVRDGLLEALDDKGKEAAIFRPGSWRRVVQKVEPDGEAEN